MKKTRNAAAAASLPTAPAAVPVASEATAWVWSRGLTALVMGATLVVLSLFLLGVQQYARHGDAVIIDMDRSVAEVAHGQAIRFERAGDYAKAKECYLLALKGRFDNRGGRPDALMRLGRMLRWHESPEAGLPYLREAATQPDSDLAVFAPLCDTLMVTGQNEELVRTAQSYLARAVAAKDDELRAQAKYFEGKGLLGQGQKDTALQAFIEAETIKRGGLSACEAGELLFSRGEPEKAKPYLETCAFSSGSSQSEYAALLLKRIAGGT